MTNRSASPIAMPSWWQPGAPSDSSVSTPDRLVVLLYSEALTLLRRARRTSAASRRDVQAVIAILTELVQGLVAREDREAVADLTALYQYMLHRLTAVSGPVSDEALAEVERLFVTLFDGWLQVLPGELEPGFPEGLESDDHRLSPASPPSP